MLRRDHTVYLPPTRLSTNGMSHPAFTPSSRASPHFGRNSFPVPLRIGGGVGLGGWLHTDDHPNTNRVRRRITSLITPNAVTATPNRQIPIRLTAGHTPKYQGVPTLAVPERAHVVCSIFTSGLVRGVTRGSGDTEFAALSRNMCRNRRWRAKNSQGSTINMRR